jgi:aminoglycoside phosphotransferase (APT) family kinase protein
VRIAPGIIGRLPLLDPPVEAWMVQATRFTEAGVAVLMLGRLDEPPAAVLKIALTREARRSLSRERAALGAAEADERLADWRHLLPGILAEGELEGAAYLLQRALRGRNAVSLLGTGPARRRLQRLAAETIRPLHERTAVSTSVGIATIDRWLAEPVRLVGRAALASGGPPARHALNRVMAEIRVSLVGRRLRVSWIHGDFWLGNVLAADERGPATGIVDWDSAGDRELPVIDLLHLLAYTRTLTQRRELGGVVRGLIEGEPWAPDELALLHSSDPALDGAPDYARAALLMYWLRHLASNLAQSSRYLHSQVWLARNLEPVLRLFERPSRGLR